MRISAAIFMLVLCAAAMAADGVTSATRKAEAPLDLSTMTVDKLLDKMEGVRKSVETFKADVTKTRVVELLDETEEFKGNIQFKTPRLLRLQLKEIKEGEETIYIVGPEYAWVHRPRKQQAERGKLAQIKNGKEGGNPLEYGLAKDIHGLKEGYDLALLPAENVGEYQTIPLELIPKGGTTYESGKIIFWIDINSWLPVQVREHKSNDEIIETHTFSEIVLNKRISDSTFEFKPPKGTDVILHDAAE